MSHVLNIKNILYLYRIIVILDFFLFQIVNSKLPIFFKIFRHFPIFTDISPIYPRFSSNLYCKLTDKDIDIDILQIFPRNSREKPSLLILNTSANGNFVTPLYRYRTPQKMEISGIYRGNFRIFSSLAKLRIWWLLQHFYDIPLVPIYTNRRSI